MTALVLLSACGDGYQPGDFTRDYHQALKQYPGVAVEPSRVDRFADTYGDFTGENLGTRLRELYAEDLYFNDTLHTHHEREALIAYLEATRERLHDMSVEILDISHRGRDLYVRWRMHTEFRPGFRTIESDTVGMSHLRFNEAGKVVLHQDFWDSRQGVFEHLPVVGGLILWIRSGL